MSEERRGDVLEIDVKARQTDPMHEMTQADLRNDAAPEEAAYLRAPENVERWRELLLETIRSIDGQLSTRRARFEEFRNECYRNKPQSNEDFFDGRAQYLQWRGAATRTKHGAQNRISEANRILKSMRQEEYEARKAATPGQGKRAYEYGRLLSDIREMLSAGEDFFTPTGEAARIMLVTRIDNTFAKFSPPKDEGE
jgi:hypothetical protein